jgi:ABC-type Fe3+ transport system substrate-binding protein
MVKRALLLLALVATVALPFILRPRQQAPQRADDTLVLISPHNEAIRHEFSLGFASWYRARTGRTVFLDWRNVGGTSDIARYLGAEYVASFRHLWADEQGRTWSAAVQSGFQNGRLPASAPADVKEARQAFLASTVSCGIDVFNGGGNYDFDRQAQAGNLVDSGLIGRHPEWFTDATLPRFHNGEEYRDAPGLWFGAVVSSYGILFNRDSLRRLGFDREPAQWRDLTDPRFLGEVALCDPTKSGSIAAAFENVVQQQMSLRLAALRRSADPGDPRTQEARAVRLGWTDGLRLLQLVGANARYFTDTSQKPAIDVANGDCAVGMCIDFYGLEQQEALHRRGDAARLGYVSPRGGSVYSVDPIAVLRGAPHRAVAEAFLEYVLSLDGQKLWNFRPGTPGGPSQFALRRLPVRRDFYAHSEWAADRTDPGADPYARDDELVYHPSWTGALFRELGYITRLMAEDTHPELVRAWRAIQTASAPARARAMAVLQDVALVDYDHALGPVKQALNSKNQADEVRMARDLAEHFRAQYLRAESIARGY